MSRSYLVILIACLGSAASALAEPAAKPRPPRPLDYEIAVQKLDLERGRLVLARAQIFLKDLTGIVVPGSEVAGIATSSDYYRLEQELKAQKMFRINTGERLLPGMTEVAKSCTECAIQKVLTAPMTASLADYAVTLEAVAKKRASIKSAAAAACPECEKLADTDFFGAPRASAIGEFTLDEDEVPAPAKSNVTQKKGASVVAKGSASGSKSKAAK